MLWTIALMGFPNNILIAFELISINRQVKMQLLTVSHLDLIRWIIKESKGKQNYLKKKMFDAHNFHDPYLKSI